MKRSKLILLGFVTLLINVSLFAQPKPWAVPADIKAKKNPIAVSDASNKAGMSLYNKNCASCHGKAGLGDGVKARSLKTPSGDFSLPVFQNQTDGELFYKTKVGRGDMPKYEGKLTDDDMWSMVNYMRTFKK